MEFRKPVLLISMFGYKTLIKPFFFRLDAEDAHQLAMSLLSVTYKIPFIRYFLKENYSVSSPLLHKNVFGIDFPNPVGLAAGFDKNGTYLAPLSTLGFGFVEIGTVTPVAQSGNEKPRLFRLPHDKALINRMGFNNQGIEALIAALKANPEKMIIGANIGKNKNTPNELAIADYDMCFKALYTLVDYFVVNVSSPNTPNLRELQEKEPLTKLLQHLDITNGILSQKHQQKKKPVLLKIAPDLTTAQLDDIIEIVQKTHTAGIVATNTTVNRHLLKTSSAKLENIGQGGLSGHPLKSRSTEIIRYIHQKTNGTIPIIGVGGIFNASDAKEKLAAGASLVQVYTGFVYEGPSVVKNILKGLLQ